MLLVSQVADAPEAILPASTPLSQRDSAQPTRLRSVNGLSCLETLNLTALPLPYWHCRFLI